LAGKIDNCSFDKAKELLLRLAKDAYHDLEKNMGLKELLEVNKLVFLVTIDKLWTNHLDDMENLREGIGLRAYGQQDPLSAYKNEAFAVFEQLMSQIDYEVTRRIFRARLVPRTPVFMPQNMITNIDSTDGMGLVNPKRTIVSKVKPVVSNQPRPGRNDPCPCGATKPDGTPKKYKHCCYPKYG